MAANDTAGSIHSSPLPNPSWAPFLLFTLALPASNAHSEAATPWCCQGPWLETSVSVTDTRSLLVPSQNEAKGDKPKRRPGSLETSRVEDPGRPHHCGGCQAQSWTLTAHDAADKTKSCCPCSSRNGQEVSSLRKSSRGGGD